MTIETKFSVGDSLMFFRNNKVNKGVVIGLTVRIGEYLRNMKQNEGNFYFLKCDGFDDEVCEKNLFQTKEELLQSL